MNHQTAASGEFRRPIEPQAISSQQSTIGAKIRNFAETQPDHPAMVSSGCSPLSYAELQSQIVGVRTALRQAGFGRNARIAVALPNGPQAALAIVGVSCAAVSVPINPRQTVYEIERCLAALKPDAVLLMQGEDSAARQAAAAKGLTVIEAVPAKVAVIGFDIVAPASAEIASDES